MTKSAPLSNKDLLALQEKRRAIARTNVNAFLEYVLRDPTGKPIRQAPLHRRWHHLMNREDRLILWGSVECGKTESVSIGRVLWEIAQNPKIRVAIMSRTEKLALRIVRAIGAYLTSPQFRELFPHIHPGTPWNAHALYTADNHSPHPTVQAFGVHGNVLGSRIDLLIIDDPLSYENTRTEEQREDLYDWYQETLTGRLTEDARVIVVANAWHPRDFLHRLKKESVWFTERFPIWFPENEVPAWLPRFDGDAVDGKVSCWPAQWSIQRIANRRIELMGKPLAFTRQFECIAHDDASTVFKEQWVERALDRGRQTQSVFVRSLHEVRNTQFRGIFCGVDLATKRPNARRKTDYTVFTVIGVRPSGDRQLLWIESVTMFGPDIIAKIEDLFRRYNCVFWIETNAAQQYIADFAQRSGTVVPVHSFETTAKNKFDPQFGVESLAVELEMGRWLFPTEGPADALIDLRHLVEGILSYHPSTHASDHLMSLWIGREGARMGLKEVSESDGNGVAR